MFRFGAHNGEEPPVSGSRGSGTVFFSRCTLECLYCQNHPWSQGGEGAQTDAAGLAGMFRLLRDEGCHNWNLVSPTPWLPMIEAAIDEVRGDAAGSLPVVYNTSGFERPEVLERYAGLADVYLTDMRYSRPETAAEGSGRADYAQAARAALLKMIELRGQLVVDGNGLALSGLICRLLVLPGRADEAQENLRWLAAEAGTGVAISVMAQYTPAHRAPGLPGWNTRVGRAEYEAVCSTVEELGFENGWMQEWGGESPTELIGYNMPAAVPAARANAGA
ncbi:MAG: radical SAM protein [Lentisphaerae bacterium]|nr:radical SAM protein [Lentisphaerota bacterium]